MRSIRVVRYNHHGPVHAARTDPFRRTQPCKPQGRSRLRDERVLGLKPQITFFE